jgi:hypothetical protein
MSNGLSVTRTIDKPWRRERSIWASVVLQAIEDSRGGCKRAAHWINDDTGLFVELAELLGFNAQAVRDKARPVPAPKAA